jgi:hypothetical protein
VPAGLPPSPLLVANGDSQRPRIFSAAARPSSASSG